MNARRFAVLSCLTGFAALNATLLRSCILLLLCIPLAPILTVPAKGSEIGFDFSGRIPGSPEGDNGAPTHLFIHHYGVPHSGLATGVTFRNDAGTIGTEPISVLILRPSVGGWTVVDRENLPDSAFHHGLPGDTTYTFPVPVPVNLGDIFAHWQFQNPGPIPVNLDDVHIDGLTSGRFGFASPDVNLGQFIADVGFTGARDYFINLDFIPTPEPSTFVLGVLGALAFAGFGRLISRRRSFRNSSAQRDR
jgi:hypothetical protein